MSWNLAKKLREARLSSSPQLFKPAFYPMDSDMGKRKEARPTISNGALSALKGTIFAPKAIIPAATVKEEPKCGILVVTFYEAQGLSIPLHHLNDFAGLGLPSPTRAPLERAYSAPQIAGNVSNVFTADQKLNSGDYVTYALLDFDKVQVFAGSIRGEFDNPSWAGSITPYKFDVSRVAELTVNLYGREIDTTRQSSRTTQDILLGTVRITPRFKQKEPLFDLPKNGKKDLENASGESNREESEGYSGVGWVALQSGTGKLKIGVEYLERREGKLTIQDFKLLKVVGRGSYGKVMQVQKKDTDRIYALKSIRKAQIISRSEVTHALAERSVLAQINHPFIVPLKFAFQSPDKLYFVLTFVNGGELFQHLSNEKSFGVNRARFYTAELLCALECLHEFNVIYRDLKPENILLDNQGHITLCDFGLCKLEMKDGDHTRTFCGTAEYLAPEVVSNKAYNKTVDWWTLGVLLYEMLTGLPPFYDDSVDRMYDKILSDPLHFPSDEVMPPIAKDLITKLLNRDPAERLGANGAAEIKSHPFFHPIDWTKLLQRKYRPSFQPKVRNDFDTRNISSEFTSEIIVDSLVSGPVISQAAQVQFSGFSYN